MKISKEIILENTSKCTGCPMQYSVPNDMDQSPEGWDFNVCILYGTSDSFRTTRPQECIEDNGL
jgi:hypothetical protein